MSSPIAKLNRFSRLFSPTSLNHSQRNSKTSLNSLKSDQSNSSPGFSFLPDEFERPVATPQSSRSPTLSSTPACRLKPSSLRNSFISSASREHLKSRDILSFQKIRSEADKFKWKRLKNQLPPPPLLRNRRFGVSEGIKPLKLDDKKKASKSGRKCNVFSASVVPNQANKNLSVLRLGGITLNSNSVSWATQSPFLALLSSKSCASPSNCCSFSFDHGRGSGSNTLNMDFVEHQCSPEKLYYWVEDEDEMIAEENIGKGGFGQVFKGTYRGEKVAIKKLLRGCNSTQVFIETFQGELLALRLRHQNLVRSFVVIQSSPLDGASTLRCCYVVMEHAGEQNLSKLIFDATKEIPSARRNRYCLNILSGLAYLHEKQLAHLDLKPSNVIVTSNDTCKICDFGSCLQVKSPPLPDSSQSCSIQSYLTPRDSAIGSSLFSAHMSSNSNKSGDTLDDDDSAYVSSIHGTAAYELRQMLDRMDELSPAWEFSQMLRSQLMGTLQYRAPELLRGFMPSCNADMYSFAITAWQIWSRVSPYEGQHYHSTVYLVVAVGLRPAIPSKSSRKLPSELKTCENPPEEFFDLLTACWNADPNQRPCANQAIAKMKSWSEI